jgi:serralysin
LLLLGCQGEPGGRSDGPDLAGALNVIPVEDRRIGILHSSSSAENFYDKFDYNQLFAAMQNQAMQAGLPYDLLTDSELVDGTALSQYDA